MNAMFKKFYPFLLITFALIPSFSLFSQTPPIQAERPDALEQYRRGRALEDQNRLQEAETYYNEAVRICTDEIALDGGTRDSYTVLTWTLRRQRKYAEVIVWGERGLRLFGDDYRIVQTMGEAYFYQNDYDNSLRYMQRYINSLPQGERASVAYFFVGEIFRLQSKFRRADIAYTTAVRLDPGMALWWYRLGTVREAIGDRPYAAEAYERAVRLNPNYADAVNGLERTRPAAISGQ
ncbi:MAG: tetratricopeptide repeat protein [Treponema sp.]|jgi:tetratricopeptide (TPR) repeat protein|nr:tetratricopeptide repeat protein [Treponema sp.]